MKSLCKSLTILTAALTVAGPALAGQTAWTEIAPDARIRLITTDTIVDGKTLAAIEIDMPETTKTYWRIPGETGIPLLLDISESKGVTGAELLWPYPERTNTGDFIDFVYHGPTVLPMELELEGNAAQFEAGLVLGICDEICVPVRVALSMDLNFKKTDAAQSFRIKQAMADVPQEWTEMEPPIGALSIDETASNVSVEYVTGAINPNSVIIDTGNPNDLFDLPQKSPESGLLTFKLLGDAGNHEIAGSPLTVTFLTPDGVFELTKIVHPVTSSEGNS